MSGRNICKFLPPSYSENLSVSCFVLETNRDVMQTPAVLQQDRMILVSHGEGTFFFDGEPTAFSKGSLIFGFQHETITAACTEGCRYLYLNFGGLRAEELLRRFHIGKINRSFSGFDGLIPLWEESLSRASEQTIDLASESIVLYTFSRLKSDGQQRSAVIDQVLQITEEEFNRFDLSITVIADELGYNPKYLSHLFKKAMKVGYSEYLRCLRIRYAVSLLDHGIDSVKNVALLSGFSDPLYFSAVFKKIMGMSPREYGQRNTDQTCPL